MEKLDDGFEDIVDNREVDTLLECLLFLAKYHKRPTSSESLVFGLPIHGSQMSPSMFIKAAKRVGLIAKAIKRDINEIDNMSLPAVAFLEKNKACIILNIDINKNQLEVVIPELSKGEITISLNDFKKQFSGNIFIVKPAYNFENRVEKEIVIEDNRKWFWSTMKKNLKIYYLVIIAAILINLFVIAVPLFTMNVYDRVLPNKAVDTLWVLVTGIAIVLIFDFILKLLRAYFIEQAGQRADTRMSSKIFDQLLNIKLNVKPSSTGMFVSRLQSFESVREFFTSATITAIVDLPFVFLFIGIIFYIGGPLGFVSLATVIISILFSYFMQKPLKETILKSAKEDQIKQTVLTEAVTGLEIIKSVRAQNRMKTHWDKSISQTAYYGNKSHYLAQIVTYFVSFISQFSSIGIVAAGVLLANEGDITMGAIIAAMILNGRVISPVSQIVGMIVRLDRTMISLNNIDEIMKMPVERENQRHYLSRPDLDGDIIFKDVSFSYKEQNFKVLKNINLKIKKGEKVGIIGKIGSGKSTIAKLLMNLYEPTEGSILIDSTELRQIDPADLRRAIGYVPQEPFLFMGTIKDNITIGDQFATDEEILRASKISGVHDFLGKHQSGYDLQVGERGDGLSGGERQSVTLARALVSNPNILILDEPTNSMDDLSEEAFKSKLADIVKDKTVIIITHRPSILSIIDRLIVIDDGRIIADGPKQKVVNSFANNSNAQDKKKIIREKQNEK
ncbi:type I secretion system permease/ATPase [Halarcobacter ebronensis]|uniref:Type I secretion system permease/ATPase n=1 Tax=Halarcobacter ebronensis TaxID=1462615 RepID=A0A4V1LRY3_9BACT|nr:type I secretion system permease/ATPase [Halarcobacter ebronensis]RXJ69798.1 type I secretion system permease/ATPase [Halarcobacter ebronensis]